MRNEQLSELVISAQNGDSEALNQLFNEYYNDLYYFALKTVKDSDLASDITQEAFIDIFNNISTLKEPVAFVSWAKKVTYFQCTRYFKKKKDILVDEDEDGNTIFDTLQEDNAEFIPDKALEKDDFKKTILAMIDELSEEQRSAVMMYYFDEMSVSQIAEIQGVSEGTVKSRLNYARKAIKKSVEEYEKKNNVKLHSIPFFPFFKWLFDNVFEKEMPVSAAEKVAEGVSASTGTPVAVFGTATATTTVATTTATVGIVSKFIALPLITKIVAGIVATAIIVGGTIGGALLLNDDAINTNADGDSNSVITESASSVSDTQETDLSSTVTDEESINLTPYYPCVAGENYGEIRKTVISDMNNITSLVKSIRLENSDSLQKYEILGYDTKNARIRTGMITELNGFAKMSYQFSFDMDSKEAAINQAMRDVQVFKDFTNEEFEKHLVTEEPNITNNDYLKCFEPSGLFIKYCDDEYDLTSAYDLGLHGLHIWISENSDGGYTYEVSVRLAFPYEESDYPLYYIVK